MKTQLPDASPSFKEFITSSSTTSMSVRFLGSKDKALPAFAMADDASIGMPPSLALRMVKQATGWDAGFRTSPRLTPALVERR
eukprot:763153-Hanusia_phi.AAC.1